VDTDVDQANARFRGWMRELLVQAAEHFSLTLLGDLTFGWRDRSIGSRVRGVDGDRWLRVVTSHNTWANGEFWTGNLDAAAIHGVPKPCVLQVHEWTEGPRSIRAELMTLVPGRVCSDTQELRNELDLPDEWWTRLRHALDVLATHQTDRVGVTQEGISHRLLAFFGDKIDSTVTTWSTAHGDLQWANLTAPAPYCWTGNAGESPQPAMTPPLSTAILYWPPTQPAAFTRPLPTSLTPLTAHLPNSTWSDAYFCV
jgi:hypothetical protein